MTKSYNSITVHLSKEEMFQYIRGAAEGESQDIWAKLVWQYQRKMTQDVQDYLWARCCKEIWRWYFDADSVVPKPIPPLTEHVGGAKDFLHFLAAFDIRNRFHLLCDNPHYPKERLMLTGYLFQGRYYLLHSFDRMVPARDIKVRLHPRMWSGHINGYVDADGYIYKKGIGIYGYDID